MNIPGFDNRTGISFLSFAKMEAQNEKIYKIFDEFRKIIETSLELHPSEEIFKQPSNENLKHKMYYVINNYHVYCKLCEQHFYSTTVRDDINSYFQKHINTNHHKLCKKLYPCSKNEPMFKWEKWLYTGYCNVCKMSNIYSHIINLVFDPGRLLYNHDCIWTNKLRQNKQTFILKVEKLKKFCGLSFFINKLIVSAENTVVCLLCQTYLLGTKDQAYYHLVSNFHFRNFLAFVNINLGFKKEDLLNGFNLETVIRWFLNYEFAYPKCITKPFSEERVCYLTSNDGVSVYKHIGNHASFCPQFLENLMTVNENDFIIGKKCLLCGVGIYKCNHMRSKTHTDKFKSASEGIHLLPPNIYNEYIKNRKTRLQPYSIQIEMFVQFVAALKYYYLKTCDTPVSEESSNVPKIMPGFALHTQIKYCEPKWEVSENKNEDQNDTDEFLTTEQLVKVQEYLHNNWETIYKKELPLSPTKTVKSSQETSIADIRKNPRNFIDVINKISAISFEGNQKETDVSTETFLKDFNKNLQEIISLYNEKRTVLDKLEECENLGAVVNQLKNIKEEEGIIVIKNQGTVDDIPTPGSLIVTPLQESDMKNQAAGCITSNGPDGSDIAKPLIGEVDDGKDNESLKVTEIKNSSCDEEAKTEVESLEISNSTGKIDKTNEIKKENVTSTKKDDICLNVREQSDDKNDQNVANNKIENDNKNEKNGKVLIVSGLECDSGKQVTYIEFFSRFGKIKYLVFKERNIAELAFFDSGIVDTILSGPPLIFNDVKLDISGCVGNSPIPQIALGRTVVELLTNLPKLTHFILKLLHKAMSVLDSAIEREKEKSVCFTITSAVSHIFPSGKCFRYGSRLSGLTLNDSDFDVFFDMGENFCGEKDPGFSQKHLVIKIADALKRKPECSKIVPITGARVPIVSFLHLPTKIHCDLSFKNGLSVQNTLLLRFIVSLDCRVRPLILFLKLWAHLNGLHGPPFFSSYSISLMVIFYLEQLPFPVIPTIEILQNMYSGYRLTIEGWDCNFIMDSSLIPQSKNDDSVTTLLLGFFEYYEKFDYDNYIIAPLTGKPLLRKIFQGTEDIELPMPYKRQVHNLILDNLADFNPPVCIMDPFDMNHILTRSVPKGGLEAFVQLCKESAFHLRKGLASYFSDPFTQTFFY